MKHFEVGMKVLCIKDHSLKLVKKGTEYIISNITVCNRCGRVSLDVSIPLPQDFMGTQCQCGEGKWDNISWFDSSLFIPVEEFQEVTYTKIIEEIPMGIN